MTQKTEIIEYLTLTWEINIETTLICEHWSTTIETDNLIRDRLVLENLLRIHVITGNLMTSIEHYLETLTKTYSLNSEVIETYKTKSSSTNR